MLLMFERGIRGGITQAVRRYASANNKYMGDLYDPNKESKYLQYLDANNLYGWAMSQPLPTSKFEWVDIKPSQIHTLAARKIKGYLLEVDVRYPTELHDSHNNLPFMCERMELMESKSWFPILEIRRIMSFTFKRSIKPSDMVWYLSTSIERLGLINPIR